MDLENKFSYHFLEGLTLTEDGILTQGNEQVYIPQKELGVLIVLLESAGHVVLKDMIIESVWKNIIVSDDPWQDVSILCAAFLKKLAMIVA